MASPVRSRPSPRTDPPAALAEAGKANRIAERDLTKPLFPWQPQGGGAVRATPAHGSGNRIMPAGASGKLFCTETVRGGVNAGLAASNKN